MVNEQSLEKKMEAGPAPLWTRGFIALLITQFLVALNDNVFRWLIIPIGKCAVGWSDSPDMVRMIGALAFLIPFLIFTSYAGYCCDRFNRRNVIISCKVAEVIILIVGTIAILLQSVPFMLFVLFCLGAQSAFFSPAKYSSLPSVVPERRISEANGYYSMTTMIACIAGQLLGGILFVWTTFQPDQPIAGSGGMHHWWVWAAVLIVTAVAGVVSSLFVPSLKSVDPQAKFPINPFYQTFADLRFLFRHRFIFWVAIGSAFFWGLGALAQSNIDKFASEMLHVRQDYGMLLLVALTLGLAAGSVLAGWWSRGRVELGLVPLGAFLLIIFAIFLSATPAAVLQPGITTASWWTFSFLMGAVGLILLGVSAGIYDIPLLATLQTKSPVETRGRLLAAYNFYSFSAMAIFSLMQGVLASPKSMGIPMEGLSAAGIWLACAVISVPVLIVSCITLFVPLLRVLVSAWLWLVYRPRCINPDVVPAEGGVLLVANHVSYLDALLVYGYCKRPVRFIAHSDYIPKGFPSLVATKAGVIRLQPYNRKSVVNMVRVAREALRAGEVVCIFPEGGITRTNQINPFEPGFLALLKGQENIPVIPVYLGGMWGSVFAYAKPMEPAFFPRGLVRRVTVAFGEPIIAPKSVCQVQQVVEELAVDAMDPYRFPNDKHLLIPTRLMLRACRRNPNKLKLADSTGAELTGKQIILRSLVVRRVLQRVLKGVENSPSGQKNKGKNKIVGLLIPTSVGGVLANVGVALNHCVPVNLNFTLSNETINYCVDKLGITHVFASKKLLQKMPQLSIQAEVIVLEDLVKNVRLSDKLGGMIESLLPTWILERWLGLTKIDQGDLNTIVLTSGSTGYPKGAMLTHSNIAANMQGFYEVFRPTTKDKLLATLPLFHSYGYSTTAWFPLTTEVGCIYHFSPLETKIISDLAMKYKPTIFPSTATFLRNYLRRAPQEAFAEVTGIVAGAEKLPMELADSWEEKFGHRIDEGFGITELSPVLSANIPATRIPDTYFPYSRRGSIGRMFGGFAVRITDLETGEELPVGESGMLEVRGHSVMVGYYNDPEKTAAAFHNGWYITGDIAKVDEQGFIYITGRQTRMSKIGGEMVPHLLIEERLAQLIKEAQKELGTFNTPTEEGDSDIVETIPAAVTAIPDQLKGEKIVVLHRQLPISPELLCKRLLETGLPPIWVPNPANFYEVEQIPILGTGKLSLSELKAMALKLFANNSPTDE